MSHVSFDSGKAGAFNAIQFARVPFAEFRVQRNFHRDEEARNRRQNHPDKKMFVAEKFLQPAAPQPGSINPSAMKPVQIA